MIRECHCSNPSPRSVGEGDKLELGTLRLQSLVAYNYYARQSLATPSFALGSERLLMVFVWERGRDVCWCKCQYASEDEQSILCVTDMWKSYSAPAFARAKTGAQHALEINRNMERLRHDIMGCAQFL